MPSYIYINKLIFMAQKGQSNCVRFPDNPHLSYPIHINKLYFMTQKDQNNCVRFPDNLVWTTLA